MPAIRVVSWSSGGEGGGRGASLAAALDDLDARWPVDTSLVVIQGALPTGPGGELTATMTTAPRFQVFQQPPERYRELDRAAQPYAFGANAGYLLAWRAGGGLSAVGVPTRLSFDPFVHAAGIGAWIDGLELTPRERDALRLAAANVRTPIRRHLALVNGKVTHQIYLYVWRADPQVAWPGVPAAAVGGAASAGGGCLACFRFLAHHTTFRADLGRVGAQDLVILAGDLGLTSGDIEAVLPGFARATAGHSHVLAYANGAVVDAVATYRATSSSRDILSARVTW